MYSRSQNLSLWLLMTLYKNNKEVSKGISKHSEVDQQKSIMQLKEKKIAWVQSKAEVKKE
jgi:hypothetical protein